MAVLILLNFYFILWLSQYESFKEETGCLVKIESTIQGEQYSRSGRIAVIRPFAHDIDVLLSDIGNWSLPEFSPCFWNSSNKYFRKRVDLIFYFAYSFENSSDYQQRINQAVENSEWRDCFQIVKYWSGDLNETLDRYIGSQNTFSGPTVMFFDLFNRSSLIDHYSYFLYMEPDTHPIRSNWVPQFYDECFFDLQDFWMKGSLNSGTKFIPPRNKHKPYNYHINGNAIYNCQDPKFREYVLEVKEKQGIQNPFDISLYMYRWFIKSWNFQFSQKFVYCPFVQHYGISGYSISDLRKKKPETFLIHKKLDCPKCDPIVP